MGSANPEVLASSEMMACSGSEAAIVLARLIAFSGTRIGRRWRRGLDQDRLRAGRDLVREQFEGGFGVLVGFGQDGDRAAGRNQVAGLVRVGEERHRRAGAGQDEAVDAGQLGFGLLGQVGQPVHARHPGAALDPRRERLGQQPRAGRGADPAGRPQAALGQGRSAEEKHGAR
jgi:hypothetical protein